MAGNKKIFSSIEEPVRALPLNTPKKLVLDGISYCIVRTGNGIVITNEACPHNKAPLSEGRLNAYNEIICPLHEYRFNLNTGRESGLRCSDLRIYKVVESKEGIFLVE